MERSRRAPLSQLRAHVTPPLFTCTPPTRTSPSRGAAARPTESAPARRARPGCRGEGGREGGGQDNKTKRMIQFPQSGRKDV